MVVACRTAEQVQQHCQLSGLDLQVRAKQVFPRGRSRRPCHILLVADRGREVPQQPERHFLLDLD